MEQRRGAHRCEVCGVAGDLVQFGDSDSYRYHCLACWRQVAEQVALEYAERRAPPAADPAGGERPT